MALAAEIAMAGRRTATRVKIQAEAKLVNIRTFFLCARVHLERGEEKQMMEEEEEGLNDEKQSNGYRLIFLVVSALGDRATSAFH